MKVVVAFGLLLVFGFSIPANPFQLEGEPFRPGTNCQFTWSAPTNGLPAGLWIYKVLPEAFSGAAVSNAMAIGGFKTSDLSKTEHPLLHDKHLIYFQNKNEYNLPRFLFIAPSVGAIEYSSQRDYKAAVEGVPSSGEVEQLARNILFQLGIDRSLLADRVRNGYDETSTKISRDGIRLGPPQVVLRGISFERRIDGVTLSDAWCFLIHFGSHGRIEDFKLRWRNLLPYESCRLLTPAEILTLVKSGRSVIPEQVLDMSAVGRAKSFSVVKITPRYFNGSGKEWTDFVYPYADMEVIAGAETEGNTIFHLSCPILDCIRQ